MVRLTALLSSLALMFALSSFAATNQNSKTNSKNATKAHTTVPANKKATKTTQHAKTPAKNVLAPAENLSGTISMIGRSGKEVTLLGSNGVPYDFDLTNKTKIEMGSHKLPLSQLPSETHKQATVHFVPTARGNMAKSIQIS